MAERLTVSDFRVAFPEFTEDLYPDNAVAIRLALAEKFFSQEFWEDGLILAHATGLYVAHFLTVYGSHASGGSGSGSGSGMGATVSKSVDGVSVAFDTRSTIETNAGLWNATPYGRELWQLMRVLCAGAVQL